MQTRRFLKIYLELFGENDVRKYVILELAFFFSFQEEERSQAVLSIRENKWGKGSGWDRKGKETYSMNRSSSPSGPHGP